MSDVMNRRLGRMTAAVVLMTGLLAPTLAFAHHPTGGITPKTFWHGFLSGVGHPVLGPDHLAFILGIGLLVALSRRWLWLPVAFVATLLPGVLTHAAGFGLGPNEMFVALSVLLLGAVLLLEERLPVAALTGAVLLAGFCHGYAFGETIVGAEATPIIAYLVGLSMTILAMTTLIAWGARCVIDTGAISSVLMQRAAAALLIVGGAVFTAQNLMG